MGKWFTTRQAAKLVGVHYLTLHHMIERMNPKPKKLALGGGSSLYQWTHADIARAKKEKKRRGRPRKDGDK